MNIRRLILMSTAAAALVLVGMIGIGQANAATPTGANLAQRPALQAQLKVTCARIPNAIIRTGNLESRIPASADSAGSVAWYQQQASVAASAGFPELSTALDNRAAVLSAKGATLANQLTALKAVQADCVSAGLS